MECVRSIRSGRHRTPSNSGIKVLESFPRTRISSVPELLRDTIHRVPLSLNDVVLPIGNSRSVIDSHSTMFAYLVLQSVLL